jgi:hypothetical protein
MQHTFINHKEKQMWLDRRKDGRPITTWLSHIGIPLEHDHDKDEGDEDVYD